METNDATNLPTGYEKGDRSKYEIIMLDNDKTPANLAGPSNTALMEAADAQTATFPLRIDRRPKAKPAGMALFTGADVDEGDAKLVLNYMGKAIREVVTMVRTSGRGAAMPDHPHDCTS